MKHTELLANIDKTLDQLIKNAEVVNQFQELEPLEWDAFQKTQSSLIAKLIYMDEQIQEKSESLKVSKRAPSYKIQDKLQYFQRLNRRFAKTSLTPIIRKTRKRKSPASLG